MQRSEIQRGSTTSTRQQEQHEHVERSVDALYVVVYYVQGHSTTVLGVCATRRNTAIGNGSRPIGHGPEVWMNSTPHPETHESMRW